MARGATIFKAELGIADMDRNYYADHVLTLACHPSETVERMMMRLLGFALFARDTLLFGSGVSTQGEPDLWEKDLTGAIRLWIEIGHPDERALRRACGKAKQVVVICHGGRGSIGWWVRNRSDFERLANLTVIQVPAPASAALAKLADRTMRLQCNIQDEVALIIGDGEPVQIELETLCGARLTGAYYAD
jgi:uncharacterized protein YaeQ